MALSPTILLIDDDVEVGRLLGRALRDEDPSFVLECFATAGDGERAIVDLPPDCVVLDYRLPDSSGLDCLRRLRAISAELPVIMLTAADNAEIAVEAMKLGASDYVVKHGRYLRTAVTKVREVLGHRRLAMAAAQAAPSARPLEGPRPSAGVAFARIVGESTALRSAMALAERAARSRVPVLLAGESGTGKELFARAIHDCGDRVNAPFLAQNCAALPEALLEGELFGHVRGAFTGADRDRRGLFEAASGGTLFLDEVSEASPAIQAKLLRVLQEREIRPLGSTVARKIDVRIVSAANVDLEAAVREGRFRQDLYYRLGVFPIRIPPLRERDGDIARLVVHFAERCAAQERLKPPVFSAAVIDGFQRYSWPGNVRQLQNEVHRLILCGEPDESIDVQALTPAIAAHISDRSSEQRPLKAIVKDIEVAMIVERLREHGYNRESTARSLGITREALWAKMRKLHLDVDSIRNRPEDGDQPPDDE